MAKKEATIGNSEVVRKIPGWRAEWHSRTEGVKKQGLLGFTVEKIS